MDVSQDSSNRKPTRDIWGKEAAWTKRKSTRTCHTPRKRVPGVCRKALFSASPDNSEDGYPVWRVHYIQRGVKRPASYDLEDIAESLSEWSAEEEAEIEVKRISPNHFEVSDPVIKSFLPFVSSTEESSSTLSYEDELSDSSQ